MVHVGDKVTLLVLLHLVDLVIGVGNLVQGVFCILTLLGPAFENYVKGQGGEESSPP